MKALFSLYALVTLALLATGSVRAWAGTNQWTSIGPEGGSIQALAIDPQSPGTVYASTNAGLFKSTDGAMSWTRTGFTGRGGLVVIDPRNSSTVYLRTNYDLFKSTDGGATWDALSGLLAGYPRYSFTPPVIDPQNSNTMYVFVNSGTFCINRCD